LAAVVVGSVIAVGTVHLPVLLVVAAASFAIAVLAVRTSDAPPNASLGAPPVVILSSVAVFTACQALPVPASWLARIAPANADVWARALLPFGAPSPSWVTLSLDPGASWVETLKWLVYAAVFATAATVAAKRGAAWGVGVVFLAAVAAALTTIAHGLVGATKVLGIYQPSFNVSPWNIGPLLNTNNLHGYLNLGAICGFGLLLSRSPIAPRWLLAAGTALCIGVGVIAASRAGFVTLPVGMLALAGALAWKRRERDKLRDALDLRVVALAAAALGGGALLAVLGGTHETWRALFTADLAKLKIIGWVAPMVRDHPWFGIGRGAFESVFPAYRDEPGFTSYTHAESFPGQWASEWGVPVAAAALAGLAWTLRPSRLGIARSSAAAGAWIGVVMLAIHNLVDLAFEVPAVCIAVATVLGSLWGGRHRSSGELPRARRAQLGAGIVLVGGLSIVAAAGWGWHDVTSDRARLHTLHARTDVRKPAERERLRGELRAAMLRHPADPYFALLGATIAWQARDDNPIPWVQRALERSRRNGRAHFLLAEILATKGFAAQALFELRLAVQDEPGLAATCAERATRITTRYEQLVSAVPDGVAGAAVLDAIGAVLTRPEHQRTRSRIDQESIARDSTRPGPRYREADRLLVALAGEGTGECTGQARDACERLVEEHATVIERSAPEVSLAPMLLARLLSLRGRVGDAEALLESRCSAVVDRVPCLKARVEMASRLEPPQRLNAAAKDLLAAACLRAKECADVASWIGDVRWRRGDRGAAVVQYTRAAQEDPTPARWLRLADAASEVGAHGQAVEALERAAQALGGADAALKERIAKERSLAMGPLDSGSTH
jgi:tetratricopeptide (TPR) repeat protein